MCYTGHGDVQRWLCRCCGYRFSGVMQNPVPQLQIKEDVIFQPFKKLDARPDFAQIPIGDSGSTAEKALDDSSLSVCEDVRPHSDTVKSTAGKTINPFASTIVNAKCAWRKGEKLGLAIWQRLALITSQQLMELRSSGNVNNCAHGVKTVADRTMRRPEPISLQRLKKVLQTKLIGKTVHSFSKVASTNELAKEMAVFGAREGTVIIAATQTHGKGRLGRRWLSPSGGIWLSTILRPKLSSNEIPKLTLMTSLAAAGAISQLFDLKSEVKWPNDVLIDARKICGILTEASTRGDVTNFVVVGIGINANIELDTLPKQVRKNATSLKHELRREINREQFLCALLEKMEHYYVQLISGRFKSILKGWKALCSSLGSYVEVTSFEEKIEGRVIDVDEDGGLLVRLQDGTLRKVLSGDINLKRSGVQDI